MFSHALNVFYTSVGDGNVLSTQYALCIDQNFEFIIQLIQIKLSTAKTKVKLVIFLLKHFPVL